MNAPKLFGRPYTKATGLSAAPGVTAWFYRFRTGPTIGLIRHDVGEHAGRYFVTYETSEVSGPLESLEAAARFAETYLENVWRLLTALLSKRGSS